MSTCQMVILLQFNRIASVTREDMIGCTGLGHSELLDNLQPLLDLGILTQGATGTFLVNGEFDHKNYKIKVPVLKKKSSKSAGGPQGSQ